MAENKRPHWYRQRDKTIRIVVPRASMHYVWQCTDDEQRMCKRAHTIMMRTSVMITTTMMIMNYDNNQNYVGVSQPRISIRIFGAGLDLAAGGEAAT